MDLALKLIPPLQVLLAGTAMGFTHRHFPLLHAHLPYSDEIFRGILLLALVLFGLSVYQFWRHRTTVNPVKIDRTSALITSGIYRFSRNPIYLADALVLVAWMAWLGAWINALWVVAFLAYVTRYQILPEERSLASKFGANWEDYRRRVRRWI